MDEVTLQALVSAQRPPGILSRPPCNLNGLDPCEGGQIVL
jgi:hypothetical protein